MRVLLAFLVGAFFAGGVSAQSADSVGLFNTGTWVGSTNPYSIMGSSVSGTFGLYEPNSDVWPLNNGAVWTANSAASQWLAIYSGTTTPATDISVAEVSAGTYDIALSFTLGATDFQKVSFDLDAAVDNLLTLRLNGTELTNQGLPTGDNNYDNLSHYRYNVSGTNLQSGLNTLTFSVTNLGGPAGLYTQITNFTVIPEAST